jgi:hypothetical protein
MDERLSWSIIRTEWHFTKRITYGFLIKVIPSEVNVSVTEVTNELVSSSWNRLHESTFQHGNEGNDLDKTGSGDAVRSEKGGNTVGVRVEGVSGVVDGSRKVDSGTGGDLAQKGQLCNTSVLDFDISKTIEAGFIFTTQLSKGIEETKRWLGSKLILEGLQGGRGGGLLGRGESSGRSDKRGNDCGLHGCFVLTSLQTKIVSKTANRKKSFFSKKASWGNFAFFSSRLDRHIFLLQSSKRKSTNGKDSYVENVVAPRSYKEKLYSSLSVVWRIFFSSQAGRGGHDSLSRFFRTFESLL